ncbi:MAG: CRISPR-associated endonuclease Cas1, partial [Thiohalorhabdaceae bacterium]
GVEVEVKTYLNAEMEERLGRIAEHTERVEMIRDDLITALAWLIEDDRYGDRAVWEGYAQEYGLTSLAPLFFRAVEPAMDKLEEAASRRLSDADRVLSRLLKQIPSESDEERLRGMEGEAGRTYFGIFDHLIRGDEGERIRFTGRSRRPPTDEANALLSFL